MIPNGINKSIAVPCGAKDSGMIDRVQYAPKHRTFLPTYVLADRKLVAGRKMDRKEGITMLGTRKGGAA